MNEIRVTGDGGYVIIRVICYERTFAENSSDANWLSCNVSIDIPPFSGRYDASFSTQDFLTFEKNLGVLSDRLSGQATFESDEGALCLRLAMGIRGELVIEGEAVVVGTARTALKFTLQADQSYLDELRRAVLAVSTEFPVRTVGKEDGRAR